MLKKRVPAMPLMIGLAIAAIIVLTAGGASPLATQRATIGPYTVLLSFYSLPRAGQAVSMTIEPAISGESLQFSQARLNPAPQTDANPLAVVITPDIEGKGVYDVQVTPTITGKWLLHLRVQGAEGVVVGDIPINVAGPPAIPTWLGWLIGLVPLPFILAFIGYQVYWRKKQLAPGK